MAHFSSTFFMEPSSSKPSLLERLSALLTREPEDREELLHLLHSAHDRNLFDADALAIIEGALQVSEMQVRDVMVPRAQMDVVCLDDSVEDITRFAIGAAHSRFPVIGENKDDVAGILLAKDLLRVFAGESFNLRDMLRPAVFVPESKRLNVLLRDFRVSRNHMAIVVDEYGGVAGLVTIEDVLEQIVGDIEDEYDFDETADNIRLDQAGRYRVKAGDRDRRLQRGLRHHLQRCRIRYRRRPADPQAGASAQAQRDRRARRPALPGAAGRQPARSFPARRTHA
jgi:magnesium and cobalt transporter